ncbi:MAG: alpha/beta hydrolase [Balneolaceae bacterium]|nr:alpha/beta hydrolase [Balneolaceae bacterium]MBO6547020.1 alpha/beta hydrolase [Balneolaceae bacterium]MBO6648033.1 alpha/beta hydrolase [Balneolaceae bacterium]
MSCRRLNKTAWALFILCLPGNSIQTKSQEISLKGDWIGHYELLGTKYFSFLSIDLEGNVSIRSPHDVEELNAELFLEQAVPLIGIAKRGKTLLLRPTDIDQNKVKGRVISSEAEGEFVFFKRAVRLPLNKQHQYLGYYKTKNGIFKVWNRYDTFRVYSYLTQTISPLYAISDGRFYTDEGEVIEFDLEDSSLTWSYPNQAKVKAERFTPYEIEEISLKSGVVTLACSYYSSKVTEDVSAVVLLPGGGNLDRENYRLEAEIFGANGISSILCDKRGTGKSTGNSVNVKFTELVNDAIAQYEYLKKRVDISNRKIGFRGPSQGGRIAIMAGANVENEAFVIATSAPIMTMKEGQIYANLEYARNLGVPETIAVEVAYIWSQYYDQFLTGVIKEELVEKVNAVRNRYPSLHLPPGTTRLPAGIESVNILDDTSTYLSKVNAPILFQYGANDDRVSPRGSISKINEALSQTESDFLILEYKNANHSLMLPGFKIASGIFMDQIKWIKQKVDIE